MALPPSRSPFLQRLPRPEVCLTSIARPWRQHHRNRPVVVLPPITATYYWTLTRRVLSQKALDRLLRRRLMLGLFPMLDERSVRRQRGELA